MNTIKHTATDSYREKGSKFIGYLFPVADKEIFEERLEEIKYPYSEQNTLEKLIHRFDIVEIDSSYMEDVTLTLTCPVRHAEALKKSLKHLSHLGIKAEFLEKNYI